MKKNTALNIVLVVIFAVICFLILLPFYAITLASFKPGEELIRYGLNLKLDFSVMSLDNFVFLFTGITRILRGSSTRCC